MRLNPCPVSLLVFRRTVLCICRNFTPLLEGCPPTTELGKWTSVLSWLVSSTWRLELFWYRYPGLVVQFLWKKWSASNLKAMVHNDRKKKGRKTRGGRQGRGRRIFVSRSFFTLFLHYLFSTVNLPFFFFFWLVAITSTIPFHLPFPYFPPSPMYLEAAEDIKSGIFKCWRNYYSSCYSLCCLL